VCRALWLRGGVPVGVLVALLATMTAFAASAPKVALHSARPAGADGIAPDTITLGPHGYLWFTESNPVGVGRINARSGSVRSFSIPHNATTALGGLASGPGGFLWLAAGRVLDRITSATGAVKSFALPSGASATGVTAGPDRSVWFADSGNSSIGRLVPSTGAVTEVREQGGEPDGITSAGGDIWFTEGTGTIGRVVASTSAVTQYRVPASSCNSGQGPAAWAITVGPDHNLWFTTYTTDEVGRLNPSTQAFKMFCLKHSANEFSIGIAPGLHGDLWFTTESTADRVGIINPKTGAISRFALPAGFDGGGPGITEGPGAALWVTLPNIKKIGRLH
jgi:virginiamycin B lyase